MALNATPLVQGWTPSPVERGTLDILWTCLATWFLSTWSAICLNVPEPKDTIWTHFKRKTWITFIASMGPEYLLGFAAGQWQSARTSVQQFAKFRRDDRWTLVHGFFADMGGFTLRTADEVMFFLDSKQILWLLEHGCISQEKFEREMLLDLKSIEDRNKSDVFVRILAVMQSTWFAINCIIRAVQRLPTTTLEITTIGMIVNTIPVYLIWWYKPEGIETSIIIEVDLTIEEILSLEEDKEAAARPWFRTPMDFVSDEPWTFGLTYHYLMNICRNIAICLGLKSKAPDRSESRGRRSDNDVRPITGVPWVLSTAFALVFIGSNFIAWNFHFPTPLEALLWRISSVGLAILGTVGMAGQEIFAQVYTVKRMQQRARAHRENLDDFVRSHKLMTRSKRLMYGLKRVAMGIRNNSLEDDPDKDMSIFFACCSVGLIALYSVFRLYILVEDVISFRALPVGAYQQVDWGRYIPHL